MVKKLVPLMILLALIMFISVPDGWADLSSSILPPEVPEDNPSTPEKVALGKKLYFDKRLSIDNTVSCATCHDPAKGFADGKKVSEGIRGLKGTRNAPTVLNSAFYELQFWDGRAITLEDQAKLPIINPVEMGMPSFKDVEAKIRNIPEYKDEFMKVFQTENLTMDQIGKAIATFERTIISVKSPFDRFIGGDINAISQAAQAGWKLFNGKARCNNCHGYVEVYPFFTDNKFHNIGVAMNETAFETLAREAQKPDADSEKLAFKAGVAELGRFIVTHEPKDIGAFKSSGLRNIALTAPYMHDGSEATLESVIDFYNKGGAPNPNLDGGIVPLGLTDEEKSQLVEFLKSITSEDLDQLMQ